MNKPQSVYISQTRKSATPADKKTPRGSALPSSLGEDIVFPKPKSGFVLAMSDMGSALKRAELWWELANDDLRRRYHRSAIGVAWIGLSHAFFLGIYILVFGRMSSETREFAAAYIGLGFLVWSVISSALVEGTTVFLDGQNWIKGTRLPLTVFPLQATARLVLTLLIVGLITAGVMIWGRAAISPDLTPMMAASVAGALLFLIVTAFFTQLLLGLITARFRDLQHVISTLMRLMFFVTPVLWKERALGEIGKVLATYNPLSHYLNIVRMPILDGVVPVDSWVICLSLTSGVIVLSLIVYSLAYRRIVFWL